MCVSHSQIHVGDKTWKLELDKNIYPVLATNLCNDMLEYVENNKEDIEKDMYHRLIEFLKKMRPGEREFNAFTNGLKIVVYENTKIIN